MRKKPTYKAAHAVASVIQQHFAHQLIEAKQNGCKEELPYLPDEQTIESMIDVAFWASLRKEEGHSPKISLAYLAPDQVEHPLMFAQRMPLTSYLLTKLAPGFERPGIHLGIWHEKGELYVWGATHKVPIFCFVLDIPEPGLLVIKHRKGDEFGKFANVAVLNGDEIKMVDEKTTGKLMPESSSMLNNLLGAHIVSANDDSVNILVQLAVSIRAHGRGGSLIIVPSESNRWSQSLRHPINYAIEPAFSGLAELIRNEKTGENQSLWQSILKREIDALAGLTAIDGAIVINDQYELLAFGAKITRLEGSDLVEEIMVTEPVVGGEGVVVHPVQSGGTRHLSAAQFVHDQKDAIALVASQDGRFTVFAWSPMANMVQAHRIEVLLL
jgi:hypothetical protein